LWGNKLEGANYITKEGYSKLRDELKDLKYVQRPKVVTEIAKARAHGDLSENAEYDAAKEKQGHLEKRIAEVEHAIAKSKIIDTSELSTDRVTFGLRVTLYDVNKDEEVSYQIVGNYEADVKQNKISLSSPIAKALIGKRADDCVRVKVPSGIKEFEIIDISRA
jgi:transcription elongation factor GreA